MLPDIVYVVKEQEYNEELRYSLRSLANLPHRRVWLAGYCPRWTANVGCIRVRKVRGHTKYQSSTANLRAALEHPDVAEELLLFNDDFFILKPVTGMPLFHRGPVDDVERYYAARANGLYLRGLRQTRNLLAELGIERPNSYELHVPLPIVKSRMLDALAVGEGLTVVHKRTLYSNLWQLGGQRLRDVKMMTHTQQPPPSARFLSTFEPSWGGATGRFIRAAFPKPGRYEKGSR